MAIVTCELLWLQRLLKDLQFISLLPLIVFCDNETTIDITSNPVHHSKTKHIELDYYFIREKVQSGFLKPTYISSKLQLVNIFTKPLGKVPHWFLLAKLGVHNLVHLQLVGGVLKVVQDPHMLPLLLPIQ